MIEVGGGGFFPFLLSVFVLFTLISTLYSFLRVSKRRHSSGYVGCMP